MNTKNIGFVIEPREIMNNEWYTEPNTMHLYRHCRLRANYSDTKWRGIELKRGQFVTSINTLSEETGLSVRQVRTAIDKLVETGYLSNKSSSKNRIITVLNYDSEQQNDKLIDKQIDKQTDNPTANEQQSDDRQLTTDNNKNKENKNYKYNYNRRESKSRRNCSYDLKDVMKFDTLDFMDEEGWEEKAFGIKR